MKAYEIHTFREGNWKISSVVNDREDAIFDAERMDASRRFSGIRVIEETFDEDTNRTRARTIYRSTKDDLAKANPRSNGKPDKTAQGGGKKPERAVPGKRKPKKEQKKKKGFGFLILILALCLSGGVAALIALRMLGDAT